MSGWQHYIYFKPMTQVLLPLQAQRDSATIGLIGRAFSCLPGVRMPVDRSEPDEEYVDSISGASMPSASVPTYMAIRPEAGSSPQSLEAKSRQASCDRPSA